MSKLDQRLLKYSAMAPAMIGATQLNAQVQYTDVVPDAVLSNNGQTYELDLNNDGRTDFIFYMYASRSASGSYRYGYLYGTGMNPGMIRTYTWYPLALSQGALIAPGGSWSSSAAIFSYSVYSSYGSRSVYRYGWWLGEQEKFMGLRIRQGGRLHYGWVRVSVTDNGSDIIIHDYAMETIPGRPIVAGSTQSVQLLDQSFKSKLDVVLNETDRIVTVKTKSKNLTNGIVTVTDVTGKIIRQSDVSKGQDFELNGIPDGKYSVVIQFDQGVTYYDMQVGDGYYGDY